MANAFPDPTRPECPSTDIPAIVFEPLPLEFSDPPPPVFEGDLFDLFLPIPPTPPGCYGIGVNATVTTTADPLGITASFDPINDDQCQLLFNFALNIPPSFTGCTPEAMAMTSGMASIYESDEFALIGTFSETTDCQFNLDLLMAFACAGFTPAIADVTHERNFGGLASLAIPRALGDYDVYSINRCDFAPDIDINIPCAWPRIGVTAAYDPDIAEPIANVRIVRPSSLPGFNNPTPPTSFSGTVDSAAYLTPSSAVFPVAPTGSFDPNTITYPSGYFNNCFIEWTSGANNGQRMAVQSYEQYEGALAGFALFGDMPNPIGSSDTFNVVCSGDDLLDVPDTQATNACDFLHSIELNIPTPPGNGATPCVCGEVITHEGSELYTIGKCGANPNLPGNVTQITGVYNNAADGYDPNLIYPAVPEGTTVSLCSDGDGGFYFTFPMDSRSEPCEGATPALPVTSVPPTRERLRLWGYPAGLLKCIAPDDIVTPHDIICPAPDALGWLPVWALAAELQAEAPVGAVFWYNMDTHVLPFIGTFGEVLQLAVALYPRLLSVELDGTIAALQVDSAALDETTVWDTDPLVIINPFGIWWMSDEQGNVPWKDTLAHAAGCFSYDTDDYYLCTTDPTAPTSDGRRLVLDLTYQNV